MRDGAFRLEEAMTMLAKVADQRDERMKKDISEYTDDEMKSEMHRRATGKPFLGEGRANMAYRGWTITETPCFPCAFKTHKGEGTNETWRYHASVVAAKDFIDARMPF